MYSLLPPFVSSIQPRVMESDPPLHKAYKRLVEESKALKRDCVDFIVVEECELPLIDMQRLQLGDSEREECMDEISRASQEWGFFQIVNHGISLCILEQMRREQMEIFRKPFEEKSNNFSAGSYRWGAPSATCLRQLSWSEAFHIPLSDISGLSSAMEQFAETVSKLAQTLIETLAEKLGQDSTFFEQNCLPSTCYLRLNRYPPCPISSSEVHGLMPHTDSDFLTVLHQDQVGGLQLVKDGRWINVKPNPEALIINIGDLLQAWSNGVYKSVEHRVVANQRNERFSIAYFVCPSRATEIESCGGELSVYRKFSFGEYRQQVQEDVKKYGYKVGLPRFLVQSYPS